MEVRVGGGTAELVHCGDGPQAVLERTRPVQGEGRQARIQVADDGFSPDIVGPF